MKSYLRRLAVLALALTVGGLSQPQVASAQVSGGTIRTTVVASDDPGAHPAVCVQLWPASPGRSLKTAFRLGGYCSTADGTITIDSVLDDEVKLIAVTADASPYGAQWVGATGGTGDIRQAQRITVVPGGTVDAPQIRLDRAGQIEGAIRSAIDGRNVSACAQVLPVQISNYTNHCSNRNLGTYRLRVGPYEWPVEYAADPGTSAGGDPVGSFAVTRSGNAPDRYAAQPVKVTSDGITQVDAALPAPGRLAVTLPGLAGTLVPYDAVTGDRIPVASTVTGETATLSGFNTRPVILKYVTGGGECWPLMPRISRTSLQRGAQVTSGQLTSVTLSLTGCADSPSWWPSAQPAPAPRRLTRWAGQLRLPASKLRLMI